MANKKPHTNTTITDKGDHILIETDNRVYRANTVDDGWDLYQVSPGPCKSLGIVIPDTNDNEKLRSTLEAAVALAA